MQKIKFYNGRIITPHRILKNGYVLIEGGKILDVGTGNIDVPGAKEIDVQGHYIAPGFIDIHVHGGAGHDFMDNDTAGYLAIAQLHARFGTTALMPTTLSCEKDDLLTTLQVYEQAHAINHSGAQFVGIHIEGPYFSMVQRGAQDPRYIRDPIVEEYTEIIASSRHIKRWSAAPELVGALEFGRYLNKKGILASIAHTDAIYEEVLPAFEAGFSHATHFYSCMSGVSRRNAFRYAGVVESAYLLDAMTVEIIADGIHLPAPLLKLVVKIKGPDRTALITDAMRAAGMPPGPSILGSKHNGMAVIVEDDVAKLVDRSAFAGSVATMDRLVRNMIQLADCSVQDAVKMASLSPARIIGMADRKGELVAGKDADLVVFDEQINIKMTIVAGNTVYDQQNLTT